MIWVVSRLTSSIFCFSFWISSSWSLIFCSSVCRSCNFSIYSSLYWLSIFSASSNLAVFDSIKKSVRKWFSKLYAKIQKSRSCIKSKYVRRLSCAKYILVSISFISISYLSIISLASSVFCLSWTIWDLTLTVCLQVRFLWLITVLVMFFSTFEVSSSAFSESTLDLFLSFLARKDLFGFVVATAE